MQLSSPLPSLLLPPSLSLLRNREGIVCTLPSSFVPQPLLLTGGHSPFSRFPWILASVGPIHAPRDLATPPTEPQIAFIPWIDWQYTYVSRVDRTVMETVTSPPPPPSSSSSSLFFLFLFYSVSCFSASFFFFWSIHVVLTIVGSSTVLFSISFCKVPCDFVSLCFCNFFFEKTYKWISSNFL